MSSRDFEIRNFHLFSNFYPGAPIVDSNAGYPGISDPVEGCGAQWKAIDVVMENAQCLTGENIAGATHPVFGDPTQAGYIPGFDDFWPYTVNRPTRIDEHNNVVFVSDYGSNVTGIPGVWAADPRDYDDVASFHQRVFGGAERVFIPGTSYDVTLDETSFFFDANFSFEDLNLSGTIGFRYIDTDISVRQNLTSGEQLAYGDTQIDTGDFFSDNNYDDILPALNLNWRPTDNWTARFSYSENMMAHDLGTYGGGVQVFTAACTDPTIVGGRCVTSANGGGNPFLDPWRTTNYDLSVEYYVGDASAFSAAVFYIDIESFTSGGSTTGSFPDSDGVIRREVPVSTIILGEGGSIEGLELAAKVAFSDFGSGGGMLDNFGVDANYTYAPSDSNDTDPGGGALPFVDNSEHQYNLVAWFQSDQWQARLAYNWRSERYTGGQAGIPGYQDSIGYLDAQVTYDATDNISIYLNGSNITGETEEYYLDWGTGPTQYWQQNEFEARYTLGVRARF